MLFLKQVENLIQKNFIRVNAFDTTENIKKEITSHRVVVVCDASDKPLGILTAYDILERPEHLAVDCMRTKTHLSSDITIHEAIVVLQHEREEALAVQEAGEIIGVVYKDELVNYFHKRMDALKDEIVQAKEALKKISWIQSHLVRQPVASILGLIQLIDRNPTSEEMIEIVALLRKSIIELDKVIADTVVTADYFKDEHKNQRA